MLVGEVLQQECQVALQTGVTHWVVQQELQQHLRTNMRAPNDAIPPSLSLSKTVDWSVQDSTAFGRCRVVHQELQQLLRSQWETSSEMVSVMQQEMQQSALRVSVSATFVICRRGSGPKNASRRLALGALSTNSRCPPVRSFQTCQTAHQQRP